jgi:molecular chaperone Hsp33
VTRPLKLSSSVQNKVEKFISADGTLRVSSVICTQAIQEAQKIHQTFPVPSAALGRALIGAGLLATLMKDEGKVALHFKGDGPLGHIFAEGTSHGEVRGFIVNPQVHVPSKNGKLNVGGGVGKGVLSVAMSLPNERQPYTGTVQIQSGEIGEDIAYYLFQSQQIPSIVALGVFVEPDNTVSAAGGSILQVMPGATEDTLKILENRVKEMKTVTELIRSGATPSDLAFEMLEDFNFRKLDDSAFFEYKCQCTMVKVERSILLLGEKEIQAMVQENKDSEVICDFCGRKYVVDVPTLEGLLGLAKKAR